MSNAADLKNPEVDGRVKDLVQTYIRKIVELSDPLLIVLGGRAVDGDLREGDNLEFLVIKDTEDPKALFNLLWGKARVGPAWPYGVEFDISSTEHLLKHYPELLSKDVLRAGDFLQMVVYRKKEVK